MGQSVSLFLPLQMGTSTLYLIGVNMISSWLYNIHYVCPWPPAGLSIPPVKGMMVRIGPQAAGLQGSLSYAPCCIFLLGDREVR